MIQNINETFGDAAQFDSVEEMEEAIRACGYGLTNGVLVLGGDYIEISMKEED